jgi:hypothetical protein
MLQDERLGWNFQPWGEVDVGEGSNARGSMSGVTTPKKPRKLPPRGERGKFIKVSKIVRAEEPEIVEVPAYSPQRIGIGERIDWQRELQREVLPPRSRSPKPVAWAHRNDKLGWGALAIGAVGIGYALSRLPGKVRPM